MIYIYIYIYTHTHTSGDIYIYIYIYIHIHTHLVILCSFIHSFICPNFYQKDTSSYFEVIFLFQAFSIISYSMFHNPVLLLSPGGNLCDGPLRKSYLQSPSTVVSATDQDMSPRPGLVCGEKPGIKCRASLFMGPT